MKIRIRDLWTSESNIKGVSYVFFFILATIYYFFKDPPHSVRVYKLVSILPKICFFCENVFLIILHATKLTERLNRFKDHAIIAPPSCCKFKYSSIVFFRRLENPRYLITCPGKCTNKLAFINAYIV